MFCKCLRVNSQQLSLKNLVFPLKRNAVSSRKANKKFLLFSYKRAHLPCKTKWPNQIYSSNKVFCLKKLINKAFYGLFYLFIRNKLGFIRAFASGFFKLLHFSISKPTLTFIPYHFTSLLTSQLLFFYSTH